MIWLRIGAGILAIPLAIIGLVLQAPGAAFVWAARALHSWAGDRTRHRRLARAARRT